MKPIFFFAFIYSLFTFLSCKKDSNECVSATITKIVVKACFNDTMWAINVNQNNYAIAPGELSAEFQQQNLKVCVQYSIITIPFSCPCCYQGPYAHILFIKKEE